MEFMHREIKNEWDCVEHAKFKLYCLETMATRLQLVRSLQSGELGMEYVLIYREEFQKQISMGTEMSLKLQSRYDRIPKVFVLKDDEHIDVFVRITKGNTGRTIKQAASRKMDGNFDLRFMSGRLLEDDEEVKGTSHAVFTYVLKCEKCTQCGEVYHTPVECLHIENVGICQRCAYL